MPCARDGNIEILSEKLRRVMVPIEIREGLPDLVTGVGTALVEPLKGLFAEGDLVEGVGDLEVEPGLEDSAESGFRGILEGTFEVFTMASMIP